jgi:hypothetical protein
VIRFHLDEHVDPAIADGLRHHNIDVTTTLQACLESATDEEHIRFALAESRVIFTQDKDFLRHHANGVQHAGIAYCHQHRRTVCEIIQHLTLLHDCLTVEEMSGRVEFL